MLSQQERRQRQTSRDVWRLPRAPSSAPSSFRFIADSAIRSSFPILIILIDTNLNASRIVPSAPLDEVNEELSVFKHGVNF